MSTITSLREAILRSMGEKQVLIGVDPGFDPRPPVMTVDEPPGEWSGPLHKAPAFNIGAMGERANTEKHNNDARIGKRDKLARRMLRKTVSGLQSSIQRGVNLATKKRLAAESCASNSHEAARFVKTVRAEELRMQDEWLAKQREQARWTAFCALWSEMLAIEPMRLR